MVSNIFSLPNSPIPIHSRTPSPCGDMDDRMMGELVLALLKTPSPTPGRSNGHSDTFERSTTPEPEDLKDLERAGTRSISPNPFPQPKRIKREDSSIRLGGGGFSKPRNNQSSVTPQAYDIPYTWLFGLIPKEAHSQQGGIGDCYFLAALRAILDHPDAHKILQLIKFRVVLGEDGKPALYQVRFPGQDAFEIDDRDIVEIDGQKFIQIDAADVGKERCGKKPVSGPLGVQLLELAYGKMIRKARNDAKRVAKERSYRRHGRSYTPILMEGGSAQTALRDMLGGGIVHLFPFSDAHQVDVTRSLDQNPQTVVQLQNMLKTFKDDSKYIYLLTASTPDPLPNQTGEVGFIELKPSMTPVSLERHFDRKHAYSVQSFNLVYKPTITVVNPHDTQFKVHTLSLEEFCQVFHSLQGICIEKAQL
jgi:hypothetical protein